MKVNDPILTWALVKSYAVIHFVEAKILNQHFFNYFNNTENLDTAFLCKISYSTYI